MASPSYYLCNNVKYYGVNGLPVEHIADAKRFKYSEAENLLHKYPKEFADYRIRKQYDNASRRNYIFTTAKKFLSSDGKCALTGLKGALSFHSVIEAEDYLNANNVDRILGNNPSIINGEYSSIPFRKQEATQTTSGEEKQPRIKVDLVLRRKVYDMAGGRCQICGTPIDFDNYTLDHIIPLSRGGANDISNYRAACRICNQFKSNRLDSEMYASITNILENKMMADFDKNIMNKLIRCYVRSVIGQKKA